MSTIAKLVKHKVEEETLLIQDVEYFEGEYIAHIQVIGYVTIKGKPYKFDKMMDVELDLEDEQAVEQLRAVDASPASVSEK